jgi:hypothetical protein
MVNIKDIGWGSYGGYEGPRYIGSKKFILPPNATFDQKVMSVVSASEGNAGSVNMYDRAIISVGFIQWIELGQYSVSDMIGYIADKCGIDLVENKLRPALTMSKATFKKTLQGRWRFHIVDGTGKEVAVQNESASRWLFARGSGKVGTWTEVNKVWAKMWAAAIADLFEDDAAVAAQVEWTVPQLKARFVGSTGKSVVFAPGTSYEGYAGALKALLVAYGVNLPAVAEKVVSAAIARSKFPKWTRQWCLDLMHDLALASGVSIWPGRYNYKRASLEAAFGIKLPKNSAELAQRAWAKEPLETLPLPAPPLPPSPVEPREAHETTLPTADVVVERPARAEAPTKKSLWETLTTFSTDVLRKLKK